jgi:hypothetical protein
MTELRRCEIEYKFDASHISWDEFDEFIKKGFLGTFHIIKKQVFNGFDDYWELNESVIRHRHWGQVNQLTVKLRKNKKSILNRIEQDLNFSKKTSSKDISEFLRFAGYDKSVSIKKKSVVLWLENEAGLHFTMVLYEVKSLNKEVPDKRFLEIEIEKHNNINEINAETELAILNALISKKFLLSKPMNKSLYEIYSGKTYRIYEKTCK